MQRTRIWRRARDAEDLTDGTFRDKAHGLFVINKYMGLVMYQVSVSDCFGEQGRVHGALDCLTLFLLHNRTDS